MRVGIIGCGINGAYLGWKLARKHEVTIFEKKSYIGKEVCSGLFSDRLWNFIPKNENLILNFINEIIIHFPKKDIVLKCSPKFNLMSHKLLDQYVSSLAEKDDVKVLLNSNVKKVFQVDNNKPQISVDKKVLEFDYLIGSDGFNSVVRKSLNIKDPKFYLGIYTYIDKKSDSNTAEVWPTRDGFAWLIPRGVNSEYGVVEKIDKAMFEFKNFCKSKRVPIKNIHSYVIPSGIVRVSKGRIALTGDAAGINKPFSFGGVIWGLTADSILLKTFPNFQKYENNLLRFFEPKIYFSKLTEKLARFIGFNIPTLLPSEIDFDSDWVF